ncbi:hypothetical protein [Microbulbifer sp. GL-2]|uniref:hypothetical protein n=1 Tax=Microbulbifer sp. GL-2 TaxID=2591606 RepID=UPI0011644DE1|nr:hypothetical protein [Microbulbifer sp. GL-2]BBM03831.1 hypothetical protein GL2_39050 [Microbulbifer sp. GL-2]
MPGRQYQITFMDKAGTPVSGVEASCIGDDIWPSNELAKEINGSVNPSDQYGVLVLSHGGYEAGGTYKQMGSYTWAHTKSGGCSVISYIVVKK